MTTVTLEKPSVKAGESAAKAVKPAAKKAPATDKKSRKPVRSAKTVEAALRKVNAHADFLKSRVAELGEQANPGTLDAYNQVLSDLDAYKVQVAAKFFGV